MSKLNTKQYDFWARFREYLFKKDIYTEWRRPLARNTYCIYMQHKIPKVVTRINVAIDHRANLISCAFYIDKEKALFKFLEQQKSKIAKEFNAQKKPGETIEWKNDPGITPTSIVISKKVPDVFDPKKEHGYFVWFYRKNKFWQKIFKKYSTGFTINQ